jgi:hypothetical protein
LLDLPWGRWPQVALTLNPVVGQSDNYSWFCDIALARRDPPDRRVEIWSWRIRNEGRGFKGREALLFHGTGPRYFESAAFFKDVVDEIAQIAKGALPVAVSPGICKPLLLAEIKRAERDLERDVDRDRVYLFRPGSRWVDLALWRRKAEGRPFSGLAASVEARVSEALTRLPELQTELGIDPTLTVPALLDWQESLKGR